MNANYEAGLKFLILFSIFTILLIIFHLHAKKKHFNVSKSDKLLNEKIDFTYKNQNSINSVIKIELRKRLNLLFSKKMTYKEWIEYNRKNNYILFKGIPYYFFIIERVYVNSNIPPDFILRVSEEKKFNDLSWKDALEQIQDYFISTRFNPDPNIFLNLYYSGNEKVINEMDYYWIDPVTTNIIRKKSFYLSHPGFIDNEGNEIDGIIIAIGYSIENISDTYQVKYNDYIFNWAKWVVYFFAIFIIGVILYAQESKTVGTIKAVLFLFVSLLYIIIYSNVDENQNSREGEIKKINSIDNGVLSAAFLVGVNIFIISSIKTKLNNHLNKETTFIFAVSLILLLFAIFRYTNYTTLDSMIRVRITSQYLFNYSVLLNAFILINYIIFTILYFKEKITF